MTGEERDFVDALCSYVAAELREGGRPADYAAEAVQVVDARCHLFRTVQGVDPDEELGIYPLRSLCRVDDATLDLVPDRGRMAALARDFFAPLSAPSPAAKS